MSAENFLIGLNSHVQKIKIKILAFSWTGIQQSTPVYEPDSIGTLT